MQTAVCVRLMTPAAVLVCTRASDACTRCVRCMKHLVWSPLRAGLVASRAALECASDGERPTCEFGVNANGSIHEKKRAALGRRPKAVAAFLSLDPFRVPLYHPCWFFLAIF